MDLPVTTKTHRGPRAGKVVGYVEIMAKGGGGQGEETSEVGMEGLGWGGKGMKEEGEEVVLVGGRSGHVGVVVEGLGKRRPILQLVVL